MSLGLNFLVLVIALLPGFTYISAFLSRSPSVVRRGPPSSGSLSVLGIVPLVAAWSHLAICLLFLLNDLFADYVFQIPCGAYVNPYQYVLSGHMPNGISSGRAAFLLSWIVGSGMVGAGIARIQRMLLLRRRRHEARKPRKINEGPIDYLLRRAEIEDNTLLVVVVLKQSLGQGRLGMIGIADRIDLDPDGPLISISMEYPEAFIQTSKRVYNDGDGIDFSLAEIELLQDSEIGELVTVSGEDVLHYGLLILENEILAESVDSESDNVDLETLDPGLTGATDVK